MEDRIILRIAISPAVAEALENAAEEKNSQRLESRPDVLRCLDVRPVDVAGDVLRKWMLCRRRR